MSRYHQAYHGDEEDAVFKRGKITARTRCCDCGLVHDYTFTLLRDGKRMGLRRKIEGDKRATAASRAVMKRRREGVFR